MTARLPLPDWIAAALDDIGAEGVDYTVAYVTLAPAPISGGAHDQDGAEDEDAGDVCIRCGQPAETYSDVGNPWCTWCFENAVDDDGNRYVSTKALNAQREAAAVAAPTDE